MNDLKECFIEKIRDGEDVGTVIDLAVDHYINQFAEVVNNTSKADVPFIVASLMLLAEFLKQEEVYSEAADRVVQEILKNKQAIVTERKAD